MSRLAAALAALLLLPVAARAKGAADGRAHVDLQNLQLRPELPAASGVRKATKLVYVMGAHSIWGGSAERTIQDLSSLPAQKPTAYSLAFVGGTQEPPALYSFGDQPSRTTKKSPLAPGLSRAPANSLQLMSKVLAWAYSTYPSEQRFLEIDSHGAGALGIGSDYDSPYKSGYDLMPIQGLARALRDGTQGRPIDVVFFNACHMASIEALYEIAPWARYAVASEWPVEGIAKTVTTDQPLLFERLAREGAPPDRLARELARQAVQKGSSGVRQEVAIDLGKLEPLVAQIRKLADALLAGPAADRHTLLGLLGTTSDLWVVARELERHASAAPVRAAAHALYRLQAAATLYEHMQRASEGPLKAPRGSIAGAQGRAILHDLGGLSIYRGEPGRRFLDHGYAQTRFARATGWDKVLGAMSQP